MQIASKNEITELRENTEIFKPSFLSVKKLMLDKKFMPVICGPTCAGKSDLAFSLAKLFETEIISIDSMQVYKGLDIGTDKYDSSGTGINQYMTDIFEPDHKVTVVEFRDICRNIIDEEFFKKERIPVMAGGSGLYLRAVIDELDFTSNGENNGNQSGEDLKIRKDLYNEIDNNENGLSKLFMKLEGIDPVYSAQISPNDKKRIVRAIEVYTLTGRPFSSFQSKWLARKSIYNCIMIGLLTEKDLLHANIEKRVDRMIARGLINEVQSLVKKGFTATNSLTQAVGYKEVLKYLAGDINIDSCRLEIIKNTKKLAKKQMTWFKADPRINWIRTDNYDNIFELMKHVIDIFQKELANE